MFVAFRSMVKNVKTRQDRVILETTWWNTSLTKKHLGFVPNNERRASDEFDIRFLAYYNN